MIRLIATDLDDTLLNEHSGLNPRTKRALDAAMAAGCGISLSSGRMVEAMVPLAKQIGVNAPMLLYNGALAWDYATDEIIFSFEIPFETALGIAEMAEANGFYIQAYPGRNYYCNEVCEFTRRYASSIRVDAIPVHRPVSEWMREHPSGMQKLLLIDTPEGADRAKAMLSEAYPTGASFMKSRAHYLEIAPEGVDKGRSLARLAEHLGLSRDEVMAFGDGQNDVTMIEAAGTGVAVANACPEALAVADRIAPPNTEDGVAQVIEEYLREGLIGGL